MDGSKKAELRLALEVALLAHRTVVFPDGRIELDTTPLPSCELAGLVSNSILLSWLITIKDRP